MIPTFTCVLLLPQLYVLYIERVKLYFCLGCVLFSFIKVPSFYEELVVVSDVFSLHTAIPATSLTGTMQSSCYTDWFVVALRVDTVLTTYIPAAKRFVARSSLQKVAIEIMFMFVP